VWSIPLGGFFPLFVVVASVAIGVGVLLLYTTQTAEIPGVAVVVFLALGMTATYGWRMGRMLLEQEHDRELA
jgi:predicted RND superfamily exporter protein